MFRTLVVRRLTAAIVLLAILGFALPATAAPGAHHPSRATTVQTPSLLDQLLSWLGLSFGPGQGDTHVRPDLRKSITLTIPVGGGIGLGQDTTDASQGMDPNGLH